MWRCTQSRIVQYQLTHQDFPTASKCRLLQVELTKEKNTLTKIIECESRTAEKIRTFYVDVFLPWAIEQRLPTDPDIMVRCHEIRFPARVFFCRKFEKIGGRIGEYYAHQYDLILVVLALVNKREEAIELAAKIPRSYRRRLARKSLQSMSAAVWPMRTKAEHDKAITDYTRLFALTNLCEAFQQLRLFWKRRV